MNKLIIEYYGRKSACLKFFKRIGTFALITIIYMNTVFASTAATYEPEEDYSSKAVYLYSLDTGEVMYESNADKPLHPASTTKIMTCILALENTKDLDAEMVRYPQSVQDYLYTFQIENGSISLGGLASGEELSMRKLLYALMLPSANEAAMMIADHIAGSQDKFADLMNKRAKELGCENTNFVNANGLPEKKHVTTAGDMAKIALHAMELPGFMDIVKTVAYDSGPTNKHDNLHWESTNLMQTPDSSYYYSGLEGIKTGTLPDSGRCFVSKATRDGFSYLLVVMGAPYENDDGTVYQGNRAFEDTAMLYDWVFGSYKIKKLVEQGQFVTEVPLELSMDKDYIRLMTSDRYSRLVHYTVDPSKVVIMPLDLPDSVDAPVKKGDKIAVGKLIYSGEEIGEVNLLAAESVEASRLLIILKQVKEIIASFWFKFAVVFIVLSFFTYIVATIRRNRSRSNRGGYYKPRRRI